MELIFTADHEQLGAGLRRLLEKHAPSREVRRVMATPEGVDAALWERLVREMDLAALALPVAHGGAGFGAPELMVVQEELGRALACVPFFSSIVQSAQLLAALDDRAVNDEYLPAIAQGRLRVALAATEADGVWENSAPATRARREGNGWVLEGAKSFVVDGMGAGLLLVTAQAEEGLSVFAVAADASGVTRQAMPVLDATRPMAELQLHAVPARLIGTAGGAGTALASTHDLALIALSAELLGVAQRCLEMSTEYARVRYQFGRPIGSFQAIKHKCASMLMAVECCRSAVCYGAWAAARQPAELPMAASLAKAVASDNGFLCAAENIQVHGGIGFTWEFDAQLYFKRAKSLQLLLGDGACHRERWFAVQQGRAQA